MSMNPLLAMMGGADALAGLIKIPCALCIVDLDEPRQAVTMAAGSLVCAPHVEPALRTAALPNVLLDRIADQIDQGITLQRLTVDACMWCDGYGYVRDADTNVPEECKPCKGTGKGNPEGPTAWELLDSIAARLSDVIDQLAEPARTVPAIVEHYQGARRSSTPPRTGGEQS